MTQEEITAILAQQRADSQAMLAEVDSLSARQDKLMQWGKDHAELQLQLEVVLLRQQVSALTRSRRDKFAGRALQGILANSDIDMHREDCVAEARNYADLLIAELDSTEPSNG